MYQVYLDGSHTELNLSPVVYGTRYIIIYVWERTFPEIMDEKSTIKWDK